MIWLLALVLVMSGCAHKDQRDSIQDEIDQMYLDSCNPHCKKGKK